MPYFPKNRVVSNLFTQGAELIVEATGQEYRGYYFKTYTGQFFSGKTPQDKPNRRLIAVEDAGVSINNLEQQILFLNNDSDVYNQTKELKGVNLDITNQIPQPVSIAPPESAYQIGEFMRYFYKKRNELLYLETTKEHYNNTLENKSEGTYTLYRPFKLIWKVTGTPKEVFNVNNNIILLTERNQNLVGLRKYLNDPLQFYRLES